MSALDTQVGGDHYKSAAIQPVQYIEANGLGFLEGCVVKRVTRHNKPTGKGRQDIEKAIHELQLLLELRYPAEADPVDATCDDTVINHPAWPDDKSYRWMAQDSDGEWYAYREEPYKKGCNWDYAGVNGTRRMAVTKVIGDWRDTLIERGADE